jgi:hypothetical protein
MDHLREYNVKYNFKPILNVEKGSGLTTKNFYRQKEIPSFSLPPFNASFTFNMPSYQRVVKVIWVIFRYLLEQVQDYKMLMAISS